MRLGQAVQQPVRVNVLQDRICSASVIAIVVAEYHAVQLANALATQPRQDDAATAVGAGKPRAAVIEQVVLCGLQHQCGALAHIKHGHV